MEQMLRLSSNIQIFRSRCYIATQQKMSTWALIPWIPITMWWLWWLPPSCYAKTPRGSTRAPTLAPGDGRPNLGIPRGKDQRKTAGKATQKPLFHLPVGWSENTQLPEQLIKNGQKMRQTWHLYFRYVNEFSFEEGFAPILTLKLQGCGRHQGSSRL